jgi:hypothetical protein
MASGCLRVVVFAVWVMKINTSFCDGEGARRLQFAAFFSLSHASAVRPNVFFQE